MRIFRGIALLGVSAVLVACASDFIKVKEGSDRVSVAEMSQVAGCQSKGSVTASVLDKVGFVSRSIEQVDKDLSQMARNNAVDLGGDTVVPGERPEIGKRTFAVYKCRP